MAEFVKKMKPLEVLNGDAFMTPSSALERRDGTVLLDPHGAMRLTLDGSDRPLRVHVGNREEDLALVDRCGAGRGHGGVIVAPVDPPLKVAIDLPRRSIYPIILVDQIGRVAGLCDHIEVYRALLQVS